MREFFGDRGRLGRWNWDPPSSQTKGTMARQGCGRRIKKRRGRRRDLVTGREDATLLSGLNIVLIKLHQLVIPSITGYLK
jgi:hypothetical protein